MGFLNRLTIAFWASALSIGGAICAFGEQSQSCTISPDTDNIICPTITLNPEETGWFTVYVATPGGYILIRIEDGQPTYNNPDFLWVNTAPQSYMAVNTAWTAGSTTARVTAWWKKITGSGGGGGGLIVRWGQDTAEAGEAGTLVVVAEPAIVPVGRISVAQAFAEDLSGMDYAASATWSVDSPAYFVGASEGVSSVNVRQDKPGETEVKATRNDKNGSAAITFVGVKSVSCQDVTSITDDPGTNETLYAQYQGTNQTFTVTAAADLREPWPDDNPTWIGATPIDSNNLARAEAPTPEPGEYLVRASCGDSAKALKIMAIQVEITMDEYLGIDLTDPTNKVASGTASATVTPAVEITNYSWTLTGVAVFTNNITATNTPESSIAVYETRAASGAYQGETLAVEVVPWGYTAETNFTVVKADIVWPDLVETNEEVTGGWVKYNSDDDDTNGVVDAEQGAMENDKEDDDLLAITLELAPGGLPTNETVSVSCEGCWLDRQKLTNAAGDFNVDRFPLTVYVEGKTISQTNMDQSITMTHGESGAKDLVLYTVMNLDLDIDSDNDGTCGRTLAEETIEDLADKPGKIMAVNEGDADADGIPDYADGFDRDPELEEDDDPGVQQFTPLIMEIPAGMDPEVARLRVTYSASDPDPDNASGVGRTGGGTPEDPYVYTPPTDGHLRLWTKDGSEPRDWHAVTNAAMPGDYIPTGEYINITQLGFLSGARIVTVYVEAVQPSVALADQRIEIALDPDGPGLQGWVLADAVRITIINKVDIAMDGNRDDTITFNNTNDNHYLFWVNDDRDVISGGREDDARSGKANCNDDVITCRRDLEDFTRLHLKVDDNTANLLGITYFLKFENVSSGSPSVNIFEAVGESLAYLQDGAVADLQIQKTQLLTVDNFERRIPDQYIKTGNQVSPFIIEGKSAGKGDLTLIVKKDGNEVCKKSVQLDLRPIAEFCEKYVVTISTGDNVNPTSIPDGTVTYTPETDEYVLYVHGWRMADWEKDRWTETVFKRLWWQNYRGHVGGFQWPTYMGNYDASELRAWRSGQALNNRITGLNVRYPGQVRVIAHSMGNVVMGEALRLFPSAVVHTYIAAQAAISAHCYDNTIANYWAGFTTPNVYGHYFSGQAPNPSYLAANSTHAGSMALYFNSQDYALRIWWEINNEAKPDIGSWYYYNEGDSNINTYNPQAGDKFYYAPLGMPDRTLYFNADRFEIFARCAESRSRALGREASVAGFGTARNLEDWGYDDARYSHSREFRSNIIDENPFWTAVIEDAHLNQLLTRKLP